MAAARRARAAGAPARRPAALRAYGEAQERFAALDGWACRPSSTPRGRAGDRAHPARCTARRLSGGEAARALLAGVLLARPNVLLLDEPTNHLDADGLAWLEGSSRVRRRAAGRLARPAFLDAVVTRVLELEEGSLAAYAGGYSAYREEKARRREAVALAYEAQQKRRRRLEADVHSTRGYAIRREHTAGGLGSDKQKRYAKKVAHKAKSRERRLRREMESERWIAKPRERAATYRAGRRGSRAARRRAARRRRPGAPPRRPRDPRPRPDRRHRPQRRRQEHAARAARGHARARRRRVELPGRAVLLPQVPHALPLEATPLAYVRERSGAPESEARRLLGHFGLEGRAALRPLRTLAGPALARGDRGHGRGARGAAAARRADEPPRPADARGARGRAARAPRRVVAAGHDRAFLAGIGVTRRLEVSGGRLTPAR